MKRGLAGLTHGALAVLAFAAVQFGTRSESAGPASSGARTPKAIEPFGRDGKPDPKVRATKRTPEEYRAAWDALAVKRLSPEERMNLQTRLLQRWAEVDLEGALNAALAESWDGGPSWGGGIENLLLRGFGQVFIDRSDDLWRMIQDKRFGILGSALVRDAWVKAIGDKSPELVLTYLPEMNGMIFRNALKSLAEGVGSRDQANHLWDQLSKKVDWKQEDQALSALLGGEFGRFFTIDDLRQKMAATGPLAGAASVALAHRLAMGDEAVDFQAEMAKIPEHLRSGFAHELMKAPFGKLSAFTEGMNALMESGDWELIGKPDMGKIVGSLGTVNEPAELAEWAAGLPPRAETVEMFHRGIEPYIRKDPEAAWDWISQFEEGTWRDRAYAEYSQQALRFMNDPEKSRQALDQIQDPQFKQTAEGWRKSWERETANR